MWKSVFAECGQKRVRLVNYLAFRLFRNFFKKIGLVRKKLVRVMAVVGGFVKLVAHRGRVQFQHVHSSNKRNKE